MGTIASRHAHQIIQNVRRVLSIEMICAMQAAEYRGIEKHEYSDEELLPSRPSASTFYYK